MLLSARVTDAQEADSSSTQTGRGGQVILTNSGFGLGGFLSRALTPEWSVRLDAGIGAVKDEREVAFFDRFGRRDVPNKANYLVELPLLMGLERQVFASRIEANFRPFLALSVGPTLGWIYPYFDDENDNGRLDDNEPTHDVLSGLSGGSLRTAITISGSFGARFGSIHQPGYGLRFGYRITRYNRDIALLEPQIKTPERTFVTPVVTVYFGTLHN
ncbi:MAG: hypothetical protein ACPG3U_00735 [Rhodothermales bacterium]